MYTDYDNALTDSAGRTIDAALANFELVFAPVPPPKTEVWKDILLSVITLVGTVAVSTYFNTGKSTILNIICHCLASHRAG